VVVVQGFAGQQKSWLSGTRGAGEIGLAVAGSGPFCALINAVVKMRQKFEREIIATSPLGSLRNALTRLGGSSR
jgi:hypothetical protein